MDADQTRPTPQRGAGEDSSIVALRAACAVVSAAEGAMDAASITVPLDRERGVGLELLRAAERVTGEFGLRHSLELNGGMGTIRVWRDA